MAGDMGEDLYDATYSNFNEQDPMQSKTDSVERECVQSQGFVLKPLNDLFDEVARKDGQLDGQVEEQAHGNFFTEERGDGRQCVRGKNSKGSGNNFFTMSNMEKIMKHAFSKEPSKP